MGRSPRRDMKRRPAAAKGARRFALLALGIFLLAEAITSALFVVGREDGPWRRLPTIPLAVVLCYWVVPFVVAYLVEGRDYRSLGLWIPRGHGLRYALYALAGLVLPAFLLGGDRRLVVEFVEQVVYIGLAEELFNRGYLMRRLCDWLGDWPGLLLTAGLFGLSHVISRLSQHGFAYPVNALMAGGQAIVGGLIFGFIYLRARNIWPPAIAHVAGNMYWGKLLALFVD